MSWKISLRNFPRNCDINQKEHAGTMEGRRVSATSRWQESKEERKYKRDEMSDCGAGLAEAQPNRPQSSKQQERETLDSL